MEKTKRYYLAVKILIAIVAVVGISMALFIITAHNKLDFGINWNMFNSVLAWPLFIIGFILGLGQKFQVYESIIETRDSSGTVIKREKNNDIVDSTMAGCIMPLLTFFVITPLIIAAVIYYSLMVIVYLFAAVFPYVIAVFIVLSLIFLYKCLNKSVRNQYRHILIPGLSILFILIYWAFYSLWVLDSDNPNTTLAMIISISGIVISLGVFLGLILSVKDNSDYIVDTGYDPKHSISRKFLITYIIASLLIIGVYSFKLLSSDTAPQQLYSTSQPTYTIYSVNTETSLNVRSGPGGNYNKLGTIQQGEKINVYSINGEWATIDYNGQKAYVSSKYISPLNSTETPSSGASIAENRTSSDNGNSSVSPSTDTETSSPVNEGTTLPSSSGSGSINVTKTTGIITSHNVNYDKFYRSKRITQADRSYLKIDNVNSSFPNSEISKGKMVYKGSNGRLETFLHIVEDDNTREILVSYNTNGDYISHIEIGELGAYSGTRAYGLITGNKVSVNYYFPSESGDEKDNTQTKSYAIGSELKLTRR